MKHLVYILSILIFVGCNNKKVIENRSMVPDNSKIITTNLIDSLGNIICSIPIRYDTFFHWINRSDCGRPCEKEEYRYQPKTSVISNESGFIYLNDPKDSMERFTIFHSGWFPFHDNLDTGYIDKLHKHRLKEMVNDPATYKIQFDTIEKINDRKFSIIVIDLYDTEKKIYSKKVLAATSIKSNGIGFQYELLTSKNDSINKNFIKNSMLLLRTIKIGNGI